MQISAELSFYPLQDDYIPPIQEFIAQLNVSPSLEVRTHGLSTEIFGEFSEVMSTVQTATQKAFETDGAVVLVAKYLNRDRR